MKRADYRAILDSWGYDWDSDGCSESGFWVRVSPAMRKFVDVAAEMTKTEPVRFGDAPVFLQENHLPGGQFRYQTYGRDPRGVQDCIEDYGDPVARERWKKYVVVKDKAGNIVREGPQPFGSKRERLDYERAFGFAHRDKGEGQRDHRKRRTT